MRQTSPPVEFFLASLLVLWLKQASADLICSLVFSRVGELEAGMKSRSRCPLRRAGTRRHRLDLELLREFCLGVEMQRELRWRLGEEAIREGAFLVEVDRDDLQSLLGIICRASCSSTGTNGGTARTTRPTSSTKATLAFGQSELGRGCGASGRKECERSANAKESQQPHISSPLQSQQAVLDRGRRQTCRGSWARHRGARDCHRDRRIGRGFRVVPHETLRLWTASMPQVLRPAIADRLIQQRDIDSRGRFAVRATFTCDSARGPRRRRNPSSVAASPCTAIVGSAVALSKPRGSSRLSLT